MDAERDLVAAAVVEHLQLANWLVEKGPPAWTASMHFALGNVPRRRKEQNDQGDDWRKEKGQQGCSKEAKPAPTSIEAR